jgi:hypothetical protein
VYFGSTEYAADYFEDIWTPSTSNPADYIMSLVYDLPETSEQEGGLSVQTLAERYIQFIHDERMTPRASSRASRLTTDTTGSADPPPPSVELEKEGEFAWSRYFTKLCMMISIQASREMLKEKRRLKFWKALSIRNVVLGVTIGKYGSIQYQLLSICQQANNYHLL